MCLSYFLGDKQANNTWSFCQKEMDRDRESENTDVYEADSLHMGFSTY